MSEISRAVRLGTGFAMALGLVVAANASTDSPTNDVLAVGPMELVEASSVTVLGRTFRIEDTSGLEAGEKVAVHGEMAPDGSVNGVWVESLGNYSAGSDQVFEKGVVTQVNDTVGRLSIGGAQVDYTAALSEADSVAPLVGDQVAVTGTQPEPGGVVLGMTTRASLAQVSSVFSGVSVATIAAGITGSSSGHAGITGSSSGHAGITGSSSGHG